MKVSVFHEFYLHIECVHRSKDSIFVESILPDIRHQVALESDIRDLESLYETAINDVKSTIDSESESRVPLQQGTWVQNTSKKRRGRPRKEKNDYSTNKYVYTVDAIEKRSRIVAKTKKKYGPSRKNESSSDHLTK